MYSSVNTIWVLFGAALVFFMQAGFAMVETGFTRAKNAGNIIMKNLMDFCIGTPVFWLVGFGIMFGAGNGFFGKIGGIASEANYGNAMLPDGVPFWAFLIFQTVFCATSATIVSGAMAERTKFISYCIYSLLISLVVYPVSGHWIWGGGFISQMGFHDFAGSCAVHMVGGVAALIGAIILGPRIGKYSKSGKSRAIPGHNLTVGALRCIYPLVLLVRFQRCIYRQHGRGCHRKRRQDLRNNKPCRCCCNGNRYADHMDSLQKTRCLHVPQWFPCRTSSHHSRL